MGLIRLAVALAALWPLRAWAEGPSVDPASLVRDGGPWGLASLFASVIGFLWWKLSTRDQVINDLQDKRADEAKATIKDVVTSSITSTNAIADSTKRLADHDAKIQGLADRFAPVPADIARILSNQEKILDTLGKIPRASDVRGAS